MRESEQHREIENKFKVEIENTFHRKLLKAPANLRFDYFVTNEYRGVHLGTALAELKCRNHNKGAFPTIYIPVDKMSVALKLCRFFGSQVTKKNLNFLYFVKFLDTRSYATFPPATSLNEFEVANVNGKDALCIPVSMFVDF